MNAVMAKAPAPHNWKRGSRARLPSQAKTFSWDAINFLISSCAVRHGNRPFNEVVGIYCAGQLVANTLNAVCRPASATTPLIVVWPSSILMKRSL